MNIKAKSQTHQERSNNKSQGWNAGVAVSYGSNGFAFGVTAGGNYGKGYGNGDEQSWRGSWVGDKNSRTTIISQQDTNLIGSQVKGKGISVQAKNLNIESLQDTMTYKGKQQNLSAQVTVGYGASASGSFNQSKVNADYASVNTQAGIFAGDEGFDVNVKKHTDLKGGLITSTATAEQQHKNHFITGTITSSDIENYAHHSASGVGVSGGVSVGGGEAPKEVGGVNLQPIGTNHLDGSSKVETQGIAGVGNQGNWGAAKGIATALLAPVSNKGSEKGITTSRIQTSNIQITDLAQQEKLTGKATSQLMETLNQQNHHQSVNKVDVQKVTQELEQDLDITNKFIDNVNRVGDDIYYNIEKKEGNTYIKEKRPEGCKSVDENCIKVQELDVNNLKVPKTKAEAEQLARMYVHGMFNTKDEDRTIGAIQYGGTDYLDNDVVIVRKPYTSLTSELAYTVFERLRAGLNMPSIFGASNASREQVKIWGVLDEYNRQNPNNQVDLDSLSHSLGVSGVANAMNWAQYQGMKFDHTKLKANTVGTSYPMTNSTIASRLSGGLYDQGYAEKASKLFKEGSVEYAAAPRDIVATGINLPWLPGHLSFGIGNTDTTGQNTTGVPLLGMINGDHTKAYYKDKEVIGFLNKKYPEEIKIIEKYQRKTWGKVGPKTKIINFSNRNIIENNQETK